MPWTESRPRDQWLAEVKRRGERIRRRRRLAVSAGVVALVVRGFAVISLSWVDDRDPQLRVAAGGPAPSGVPGTGIPSVLGGDDAGPTTTVLAALESAPPGGPLLSTTTEVRRPSSSTGGMPVPDDAVDPSAPPSTTATDNDSVRSSPLLTPPSSTTSAPSRSALAPCPPAEVGVTVTTDRSTYARGETVRWSSTLENRSGTTCLVSGRAFFHVEDSVGKTVGSFAYTADYMLPVKAEPGKAITNSASWDQRDCSGSACVQVPSGTYLVVAEWTEAGPYTGRGAFTIAR